MLSKFRGASWKGGGPKGYSGGPIGPAREPIGHATSKVPPYWEPGLEQRGYPFRTWLKDLDVWSAGTELREEQQAPAVAQRLGGAARALIREVPSGELRDGRWDVADGVQISGLTPGPGTNTPVRRVRG